MQTNYAIKMKLEKILVKIVLDHISNEKYPNYNKGEKTCFYRIKQSQSGLIHKSSGHLGIK